jgi:ankyrin repeat protein
MTSLHWAVYNHDELTVKYLLERGAKQIQNKSNHTPVDVAGFCRIVPLIDMFIEYLHTKIRPRFPQYNYLHTLLGQVGSNPNVNSQIDDYLN